MMSETRPLSKTLYLLRIFSRRIWVRTSAFVVLALVTVLLSRTVAFVIPGDLARRVDPATVLNILTVLSSSMLAVTTFSLSVIVSARQAITSGITPRAHKVAIEDPVTQTVLATFLGAFVYSLTAQVVIETGLYEARSATMVLIVTIFVIALVVGAMLRWIEQLTTLGSIPATVAEIEEDCAEAIGVWRGNHALGARTFDPATSIPAGAAGRALAPVSGYVQHIDLGALDRLAEEAGGEVFILRPPGAFVARGEPLCRFSGTIEAADIAGAFSFDATRSYEQDPRFGIIVLAEIAQRALSPAVNDPGTAIFILGRLVALLAGPEDEPEAASALRHVLMPPLTAEDLISAGFDPIARDGAAMIEVQIRVQKSLFMLAALPKRDISRAALTASERALEHGLAGLKLVRERETLGNLVEAGRAQL